MKNYDYEVFGTSNTDIRDESVAYTTKGQDATGLYYFNARYYDPTLGRFISEDPAKDGPNWYIYCNNNPLKYVDPTGLSGELTAAWFSSTWWLCGVDGLLPVGDLIYVGTGILIGAGETIITFGDKLPGIFQWAADTGNSLSDKVGLSGNVKGSLDPNELEKMMNHFQRFWGKKSLQNHHLINQGQADHPILKEAKKLGIDFTKEAWNIVEMPHQGGHIQEYYEHVTKKLDLVYKNYLKSGSNWSVKKMRTALQKVASEIFSDILEGRIQLYR